MLSTERFSYLILVTFFFFWSLAYGHFNAQLGQHCKPCLSARDVRCDPQMKDAINIGDSLDELLYKPPANMNSTTIVLFWSSWFSQDILMLEMYNEGLPEEEMRSNELPLFYRPKLCVRQYPQFLITTDRSYLKEAKALIFHWDDFQPFDLPTERSPDQLWIVYNMENPVHSSPLYSSSGNLFNLTATYRFDSSLPVLYAHIYCRPAPLPEVPTVDMSSKAKPIAWFVSNCFTINHREDYVKELQQFIPVDIYGSCGPLTCERSENEECYRMAEKNYFFYLSFENANCKDYVTEKLFKTLTFNIVPVVFGGANYSQFMPPHSYIDANQMKPEELAKLLLDISKNQTKYLQYLEWKRSYYLVSDFTNNFNCPNCNLYCALFKMLQDESKVAHQWPAKSNIEINSWYFDGTCDDYKSNVPLY